MDVVGFLFGSDGASHPCKQSSQLDMRELAGTKPCQLGIEMLARPTKWLTATGGFVSKTFCVVAIQSIYEL